MLTMTETCPNCGEELSGENAAGGLCGRCLLARGIEFASTAHIADLSTPGLRPFTAPDPVEVEAELLNYDVHELIGQGGMGAVYKARQRNLDRTVAIKILPRHAVGGHEFADRFQREVRALARLRHPNIVMAYDFGLTDRYSYCVMEYVGGPNLREYLRGDARATRLVARSVSEDSAPTLTRSVSEAPAPIPTRSVSDAPPHLVARSVSEGQAESIERNANSKLPLLPARRALQIARDICSALQYAHENGVVHRDIKPENVLLDESGRIKIADFGLAKLLNPDPRDLPLTQTRHFMGTLNYMSPEQCERPHQTDHRADIYSLGVVLYELLTGELPLGRFDAPSSRAAMDPLIDDVVLRALEKDPARRYQTAAGFGEAIQIVLDSPDIDESANAPDNGDITTRPVRQFRGRKPLVAAALFGFLAIVYFGWQIFLKYERDKDGKTTVTLEAKGGDEQPAKDGAKSAPAPTPAKEADSATESSRLEVIALKQIKATDFEDLLKKVIGEDASTRFKADLTDKRILVLANPKTIDKVKALLRLLEEPQKQTTAPPRSSGVSGTKNLRFVLPSGDQIRLDKPLAPTFGFQQSKAEELVKSVLLFAREADYQQRPSTLVRPLAAIRWENERPYVEIERQRYELLGIEGYSIDAILQQARKAYPKDYQVKVENDLNALFELVQNKSLVRLTLTLQHEVVKGAFVRADITRQGDGLRVVYSSIDPAEGPAQGSDGSARADDGTKLIGPVQLEVLGDLDQLIMRGHPRDVARIEQALRQFEERAKGAKSSSGADATKGDVSTIAPQKVMKIFSLKNSTALDTVQMLQKLFPKSDVSLAVDESTNSIIGEGDNETMSKIEAILLRLDESAAARKASDSDKKPDQSNGQKQATDRPADGQKANPTEVLRSFALRNIPALDAQRMLRQSLPNFTGRVAVDDRTNSILIGSDSETLNKVAEILQRLDQPHDPATRGLNPPPTGNFHRSRQQIEHEIAVLRSKRSEKEQEFKLHNGIPNAVATPESKRLEQELNQLAQQITKLETELRNAPDTVAEPKTPPAPSPADLSNAEKFARLSRQIAQIDELISKLETELDGKWKELSSLLLAANETEDSKRKKDTLRSDIKYLDLRITALEKDKEAPEKAMKVLWDDASKQGGIPEHLLKAEIESNPRLKELREKEVGLRYAHAARGVVVDGSPTDPELQRLARQLAQLKEEAEDLYLELRESAMAKLIYGEQRPEETIPVLEKRVARLTEMIRKDEALLKATNDKLAALSKDSAEIEALKAQIEDISKSNEEITKKLDAVRAELATTPQKPGLSDKIAVLNSRQAANEEQLRDLRAKKLELSKKLGVGDDLNEMRREQTRLLTEIQHIRNGMHTLSQRHLNAEEELERLKAKAEALREGKIPEALLRDEIHKNPRMIKLQEKIAEFMEEYKYTAAVAKNARSNPIVAGKERQLAAMREEADQLYTELRESAMVKLMFSGDLPEVTIPVLEKRVERLTEMIQKGQAELQATNEKLAALSKDSAEVEALKAQIEEVVKSNEEIAKKLDAARAGLANNREKPDLLEKTQILERQHSANQEQLRSLREQKLVLSKKLRVGNDLNEVRREQTRLLTEIQDIKNWIHTLEQRRLNAQDELELLKAKAEALREGKFPEAILRQEIHKNPRMIKLREEITQLTEEHRRAAAVPKQPQSNPAVERYERRLRELNQQVEQLQQQLRDETLRKRGYLSDPTGKPPISPDPFAPRFESPDPIAPRTGTGSDDPFAPRVDPGATKSSKEKAPVNAPEKPSPH